ncbi:MAG TPA: hypothetical protein VFR24_14170, partial [Candidatus Angelobacter sp.]|nr:hypothetical protein [Candidatus Angelobacter sp.]
MKLIVYTAPWCGDCRVAKAELRFLYPIATVPEPSGSIASGDGLKSFGDSLIQSFSRARFGSTQ